MNPKFPRYRVMRALNDDLADLSAPSNGLYRIVTTEVPWVAGSSSYELDSLGIDGSRIYEVTFADETGRRWRPGQFRVIDSLLHVNQGYSPFATVRVDHRGAFGFLGDLTDLVAEATGLWPEAFDLPPLGAALRLLAGRPVKETFGETQGEPRRAEETGTQEALLAPRGLAAIRAQRIAAEASRLSAMHPRRRR